MCNIQILFHAEVEVRAANLILRTNTGNVRQKKSSFQGKICRCLLSLRTNRLDHVKIIIASCHDDHKVIPISLNFW